VLELLAGTSRVVLDEVHGGRVERLVVAGRDLLVPPDVDDHNYGAFPMAPWAGRVRHGQFSFEGVEHRVSCNDPPHAIHGIARDRRWRVDESTGSSARLSVRLDAPWPLGGQVVQRFDLAPARLRLTMEVHAADRPMPATCGWHPWWYRTPPHAPSAVELELHADAMYALDDEGIPTGELVPVRAPPWDDCFTRLGSPAAVLRWPGATAVTVETDCPCLVVFTEPEHALCVEPQSGPPDAFNLGDAAIVSPGTPLVARATFRFAAETPAA